MVGRTSYETDRDFGTANEDNAHAILERFTGSKLQRDTYRYAKFDYFNDSMLVELKTRRVPFAGEVDMLVSLSKWTAGEAARAQGKRVLYVFDCTDGMYYYEQTGSTAEAEFPWKVVARARTTYGKGTACVGIPCRACSSISIEIPCRIPTA